MKNIYILFFSLITLAFTACQQEDLDYIPENKQVDSNAVPVNISFSMESGIENDTEYVPMRSGISPQANTVRLKISNIQRAIIAKKVGNRWLFETTADYVIDPNDNFNLEWYEITDSSIIGPFKAQLTPGTYKATVITGVISTKWHNTNLKRGDLLGYTDGTPFTSPLACSYTSVSGNGYLNLGSYALGEEIFAGSQEFEVKKTEDLHTSAYSNSVTVTLERKVTKLRLLLECDPTRSSGDDQFYFGQVNGISAHLQTTPATPFCNGLNVWGEPYYDTSEVLDGMKYGVYTTKGLQVGSNGSSYLMGMKSTRQMTCFYFSDPKVDIPITVSEVDVTANSGMPRYTNVNPPVSGLILKHNQMTGMIFKPGTDEWEINDPVYGTITYRDLYEVRDGGGNLVLSTDIFPFPHEYANVGE